MNKYQLKYIDLFAGCGGLSLGLFNSGHWKGVFAIEKNTDAFQTLKHNLIDNNKHFTWPSWLPVKAHDINSVLNDYESNLKSLRGKIDLIAGGPPCQGFSAAGKRLESDQRNDLINSYVKFIRIVQPKMIFFENVKGFMQKFDKNKDKGRVYSQFVQKSLRRSSVVGEYVGYEVFGTLIDFSDFGIPQKRSRFILVGVRKDLISLINPEDFFNLLNNDKENFLVNKNIGLSQTLEDAISDLLTNKKIDSPDSKNFKAGLYNPPSSGYQILLRGDISGTIPDSHRIANHGEETIEKFKFLIENAPKNKSLPKDIKDKFRLKKRTIIPLSPNLPTPTITTLPDDYIHYCEPRIFSVREYARIQSFNDWYEFKGKYTTGGSVRTKEVPRYSQIGNAIPPLFGEMAAIAIKKCLENAK